MVYPFQYNPVAKPLRVYHQMTVAIEKADNNGANVLASHSATPSISAEFDQIYRRHFINYAALTDYTPVSEDGKMLVICHEAFMRHGRVR